MSRQARIDPDHPRCSIRRSLELLGERWTFLILREALAGATRFSDFREGLGVATDLLADRLATLVDIGVMEKRLYKEAGHRARYDYHLTQAGEELRIVLGALQQWGDQHCPPASGPSALRRSRITEQRLNVAFVDESGHAVDLGDVEFVLTAEASS